MKIGIVCYPTYGGSGVIATELGMGLARKGHEIHFITYRMPFRLSGFQQNVSFHEVQPLDYPLFDFPPYETSLTSKIVDVVLNEKLDLLHVHYAVPHASVAYLSKKILQQQGYELPIMTTLHGTDITLVGIDQSISSVVEFSINNSDCVTSVSESLREDTLSLFDIKNEIEVIPNFIDSSRFYPRDVRHFRKMLAKDGEFIFVHVSNFRPVKRVDDVVRCFNLCHRQFPSKLILVGDGPERSRIECLVRDLDIESHVRFLGKQDNIEEILSLADIMLLCSEKESFGLVALEAMACGVPVISSDAGGISEINEHGVTGFLSPVGDYEDMACNALKILKDDEVQQRFRANALKQSQRFQLKKILSQYEHLYTKLLTEEVASA